MKTLSNFGRAGGTPLFTRGQADAQPLGERLQTYPPDAPQARMHTCPAPPISPEQRSAGPADRKACRNMIHSHCETCADDDSHGLSGCPAAMNLSQEMTFYCPR